MLTACTAFEEVTGICRYANGVWGSLSSRYNEALKPSMVALVLLETFRVELIWVWTEEVCVWVMEMPWMESCDLLTSDCIYRGIPTRTLSAVNYIFKGRRINAYTGKTITRTMIQKMIRSNHHHFLRNLANLRRRLVSSTRGAEVSTWVYSVF